MPRGWRRLAHRAVALKPRGVRPGGREHRRGSPQAGRVARARPAHRRHPRNRPSAGQSRLGRTARRRSRARVLVLRGGGGDRTKARGAVARRRCDLGLRPSRSRGRRRRPRGAPRGGRARARWIRRIRPGRRDPVHSLTSTTPARPLASRRGRKPGTRARRSTSMSSGAGCDRRPGGCGRGDGRGCGP